MHPLTFLPQNDVRGTGYASAFALALASEAVRWRLYFGPFIQGRRIGSVEGSSSRLVVVAAFAHISLTYRWLIVRPPTTRSLVHAFLGDSKAVVSSDAYTFSSESGC